MRKSLLLAAVIGTFAASNVAFAEEAAPAAAPESPHSFSYNLGLYSQYIFRGLTQTGEEPALQGGADYSHSSGFYAGVWGTNISWLEDANAYNNSSLEVDIYGGYAAEIGETGISYDVGLLQYLYPGDKGSGVKSANTTEIYGSLGYGWVSGKLSVVVSDGAFGLDNGDGTTYTELNADIPLPWYGLSVNAHIGYQDFSGKGNSDFDYTDWKIGLGKSWDNGVNVGGYYTATDTKGKSLWTDASGQHLAKDQFVFFVQKTF
ncbi:hypothetical protein MTYP_01755 [Methylophilaceae bacterium]|nr:hypothetical protein MTYP_01755 [Methylophilaceae bacterium]